MRLLLAPALAAALLLGRTAPVFAEACPDFDQDGTVTIADAFAVVDYFGTFAQGPRYGYGIGYVGRFDLNHDQHVDVTDILLVIQRIGEQCTPAQGPDA